MSLLEALTMTSGLVYLVLLLWQGAAAVGAGRSLCCCRRALAAGGGFGTLARTGAGGHDPGDLAALSPPAHAGPGIDSQRLRTATRQLLLLCWWLVAVQYVVHIGQLGQGMSPWLVRPDVVDGFLPIAQVVSGCGPGSGRG